EIQDTNSGNPSAKVISQTFEVEAGHYGKVSFTYDDAGFTSPRLGNRDTFKWELQKLTGDNQWTTVDSGNRPAGNSTRTITSDVMDEGEYRLVFDVNDRSSGGRPSP